MRIATENSRLINYENTDFSWSHECARCNLDIHGWGVLTFQATVLLIMPTIFSVVQLATSNRCSGTSSSLSLSNIVNGVCLAINVSFLALSCFLSHRYRCCNVDPVYTSTDLIVREKCCIATTMGFSIINITANVVCFIATNVFCKKT